MGEPGVCIYIYVYVRTYPYMKIEIGSYSLAGKLLHSAPAPKMGRCGLPHGLPVASRDFFLRLFIK